MSHDEIKDSVIQFINSLSDKEIIEIDADRLGAAVFKLDMAIRSSSDFVDGIYTDIAVQSYWIEKHGPFRPIFLYGGGEEDVYELAYKDTFDSHECALDEKLGDNVWVRSYAAVSRAKMLSNTSIFVDRIIDFLGEDLDDQNSRAQHT